MSQSCEIADIHRRTHYDWLENDPEYVKAFQAAEEEAADRLEEEARRRAILGVEEPVYQNGECVGYKQKYSDTLLIFLLKGERPDKFAERSKIDADVNMSVVKLEELIDDADNH